MPAPLLLDLSHTSHTGARTGIQRVTRSLHVALADRALAITHDPFHDGWRPLEGWELRNLESGEAAAKRGARWPWAAKMRGHSRRLFRRSSPPLPVNCGVVVPEVFSPAVARALPSLFKAAGGPRVALFHDAIALKFPELTPTKTVARFPPYLVELLSFDGIAAVSEDSRAALLDYWRWLGVARHPPVQAITLGIHTQHASAIGKNSPASTPPKILCVGSIEGRKNHLALLEACEDLWVAGEKFSVRLLGLAHSETGAPALTKIRALQAAGHPLSYDGPTSDAAVTDAYRDCTFSVYPSLIEGFGLPVIESVSLGKPCICSGRGALGESARGGGCVMLESMDRAALGVAIKRLVTRPAEVAALAAQARARHLKTWTEYADDLLTWMRGLRTR